MIPYDSKRKWITMNSWRLVKSNLSDFWLGAMEAVNKNAPSISGIMVRIRACTSRFFNSACVFLLLASRWHLVSNDSRVPQRVKKVTQLLLHCNYKIIQNLQNRWLWMQLRITQWPLSLLFVLVVYWEY